jgi:hypothetical protein
MWKNVGKAISTLAVSHIKLIVIRAMSVLDDFVRMRLYRERASEFEMLAETEDLPDVRLRYRIVARHAPIRGAPIMKPENPAGGSRFRGQVAQQSEAPMSAFGQERTF